MLETVLVNCGASEILEIFVFVADTSLNENIHINELSHDHAVRLRMVKRVWRNETSGFVEIIFNFTFLRWNFFSIFLF